VQLLQWRRGDWRGVAAVVLYLLFAIAVQQWQSNASLWLVDKIVDAV